MPAQLNALCQIPRLYLAWNKVKAKGAVGGIDGISILEFEKEKRKEIPKLSEQLKAGTWKTQPYLEIEVKKTKDPLAFPVAFGFLGAMAYHLHSNWTGYPISGYLGACQARYYLAMIVPLAYIMCTRIPPLLEKRRTLARVLALVLITVLIAGDGLKLLVYGVLPAIA